MTLNSLESEQNIHPDEKRLVYESEDGRNTIEEKGNIYDRESTIKHSRHIGNHAQGPHE